MLVSPSLFSGSSAVAHTPISARSSRERKVNSPKAISAALRCQDSRARATYMAAYRLAQYHPGHPDNPRRTRLRVLPPTPLVIEQRQLTFIFFLVAAWLHDFGVTASKMESRSFSCQDQAIASHRHRGVIGLRSRWWRHGPPRAFRFCESRMAVSRI